MMWLVDYIWQRLQIMDMATKAWVEAKGYATEAWVLAKGYATEAWVNAKGYLTTGFVDRGDPAGYDYRKVNFVTDSSWHTFDLSAIVPAGAKAIFFRARIANNYVQKLMAVHRYNHSNTYNSSRTYTTTAGVFKEITFVVAVDETRRIRYYFTGGGWTSIDICICGWWI